MRRLTITIAAAMMMLPLLSPEASATTTDEPAPAEVQEVGPGQYFADSNTFKISELDVSEGVIGRQHGVAAAAGDLARPQSAPATRPELAVFGPGWQAEFLGGAINRKLEVQSGAIVATELADGTAIRYTLKSSVSFPDGGGIQTYEDTTGSKITQTTKWDAVAGTMRTTMSEAVVVDPGAVEAGDDTFTDANGNPVSAADLKYTYTWAQPAGLQSTDTWRVTSAGTAAYGKSTVGYDSQGRIGTITEPAGAEAPATLLTFAYATTTTAIGSTLGDYAGRLKGITVTAGTESPQTLAGYAYDPSGLLRTVTDPSDGSTEATYGYDEIGRLTSINSSTNGGWQLAFTAGTAAPTVTSTDSDRPAPDAPIAGAAFPDPNATGPPASDFLPDGVDPPQAYPKYCPAAKDWMWWTKIGCLSWAAHYGWHIPSWKRTASGFKVMGITHDHCTQSPDRPSGFDFRPACDSHDYGYGVIGNSYKHYKYYLDRSRKADVDGRFYITLRDKVCGGYFILFRATCRRIALVYWGVVRVKGNPKNGANAT
ncbi:phospholipase A2 [Nonomuraea sp. NPDC026600]|uniref:phospholipase A2 n=1 Tax=Nonomuraea sp. NPDC026600 TaxID=3155363 RepID=UPI0034000E60